MYIRHKDMDAVAEKVNERNVFILDILSHVTIMRVDFVKKGT